MVFATELEPTEQPSSHRAIRSKDNKSQASTVVQSPPDAGSIGKVVALGSVKTIKRSRPATSAIAFPNRPVLPLRLRLLNRLQQGTTVMTGLLVTGALVVYGSTVYVDKSMNRALAELDALQGESQQLTAANESIKQSLAEQAVYADSGLEPYEPSDVMFLTPAPRRAATYIPRYTAAERPRPLGY